ncbi:class I SAM-dependent methyltransferase [Marinactinospora rubrisoli]|uniref:Class I SAM-dependent methyltransferase n=1 Tax=Marinactinospora rubrisoli TaxID=2715399 RepID=A0ABW2KGV0_9ACTN
MTAHSHEHAHGHAHAHEHAHGHGEHPDWAALADHLENGAELHLPALRQAAGWLAGLMEGTPVRRILDVGSGPGVATCLLAERFETAETVAVDGTPALLERTRDRAGRLGLAGRVHTLPADLPGDFGELGVADLVWSSLTVHHVGDQQAALNELARSLRPGGLLAVAERGLPARFLPRDIGLGRPGLQARLDAAVEDWFTAMRAELPDSTPVIEDWPAMLAATGLVPAGSRSFLVDLPAPLPAPAREYLHTQLSRTRHNGGDRLDEEDLATLDRLLDRDSATGILTRPDAFYLTAITVHTARA